MADELSFDLELQSLCERSIDRLLKADIFDREAFDALLLYLDGKAFCCAQNTSFQTSFVMP